MENTFKKNITRLLLSVILLIIISVTPRGKGQSVVTYDHESFKINDQDVVIYGGSMHYFRCPRELWADRLLKIKRAGFNTVTTVVPWNYHVPIEGRADLSEFEDFVDLLDKQFEKWKDKDKLEKS